MASLLCSKMKSRSGMPAGQLRLSQVSIVAALATIIGLSWAAATVAEEPGNLRIAIVHGQLSSYQLAARTIKTTVVESGHECALIEVPKGMKSSEFKKISDRIREFSPQLIVTSGQRITKSVLEAFPEVPVVFFLVPNILDAPFVSDNKDASRVVSGVSSDQAPHLRMAWIHQVAPGLERVGVLHSPGTERTVASLVQAGEQHGLKIISILASRKSFPAAIKSIQENNCDGILMIPDSGVYDSTTIRKLLTWGARNKKPVMAFSKNIVKAGAYSGQYYDARAIGTQTAELILNLANQQDAVGNKIEYTKVAATAINEHIAEMIDIDLQAVTTGPNTVRIGEK